MKPSEKLDSLLNLIATNNPYITEADIFKKLESKNHLNDFIESRIILKKLCADKYIAIQMWESEPEYIEQPPNEFETYYLTFEGKVFIENGGYTGEQKKKARKQILEATQTWAIAIGTALAGIYAIVEIIKLMLSKCP
jgi:hypothetical protein